jgi:hypothetical protein
MNKDKSAKLNKKKKLSQETTRLLAEGYEENAEGDLAIAKDFEAIEEELDEDRGE